MNGNLIKNLIKLKEKMIKINESQRRKMHEIIKSELVSGKTKEDIFAMGKEAGITREIIQQEIDIIEQAKNKVFWDLTGITIFANDFDVENEKNIRILRKYIKNPSRPRIIRALCAIPGIITLMLLAVFPSEIFDFFKSADEDAVQLIFLPFLPIIIYYGWMRKLQIDLINYKIAHDQNWAYSPDNRQKRWKNLNDIFPEIFKKGSSAQNLSDEFWGDFLVDEKTENFWTGTFSYTVQHGKSSTTYKRTIFGFRLNKKLNTRFCLKPENIITGFFRRKKEIDLESIEFNKAFAVYYNGRKSDNELEIVKTLSPSLQTRLIEMRKSEGNFELLFVEDVMIFSFTGELIDKMKSNFFKKIEIAPEDIELIKLRLQYVFTLGFDIARFLD